MSLVHV